MAVRKVSKNEQTRDGRVWVYEIRYHGKRIKSRKYKTRKQAEEAERAFYTEKENSVNPSNITLGDLFHAHYEYQKDKVKITTLYNYEKRLRYFDSIINIKVDELTIYDIEKWKAEMNSRELATGTKNDVLKYLKATLNYGARWYDINFSSLYSKIGTFNNPNEIKKEMDFYDYDEFKKFINVEDDIRFKCLFETLYFCGLRRGEVRGLQWKNIDFKRNEISVVKNVINISGDKGRWKITSTKTRSSTRQIPISEPVLSDLKKLKVESNKYYGFDDDWFVFGDVNPIHPDTIRVRKNRNAKLANIKQIRIHDFRHSCASLLINNGANITMVARYLGHAKVDETLNTYSHMYRNKLDDIVNTFAKLE